MARIANRSKQTHLVLLAFLERPSAWRHGYDLAKQTGLQSGTLYPLLMRLSEQGMLIDDWELSDLDGRPPRHIYRLSPEGVKAARAILRNAHPAVAAKLRPSRSGR
jgi:DNA-binding PadR family transcriptional regulator